MESEEKKKNGKTLIFRYSYKHPITGEIIRSKAGRPFPIWVDSEN